METETRNRPAFANLKVTLEPGDRLIAESDAMASMTHQVQLRARWNGGVLQAVLRRVFGGESLFVNEFTSPERGEVIISQPLPGDVDCLELRGTTLFLQPGAFLCCESSVQLGMGWAGLASFIGGEGLFRLRVSGHGKVWFGAYGGIYSQEVSDELVVDTGHLIAYEPSIALSVGLSAGIFSSFFSGEGLVTRVRGPGRVYLQTRSMNGLAAWTNSHIF